MNFDTACSLGLNCFSASLIKRHGFKLSSYPFDWIFSNPNMILHCLEDNFKIFLDKNYYKSLSGKRCGHNYYHPILFNHHNPLTEEDYNYYCRCVERFEILLKSNSKKLFILSYINQETNKHLIIEFNETFKKFTSNYILLIIYTNYGKNGNSHKFTYHHDIHFLEINSVSHDSNSNEYLDKVFEEHYNVVSYENEFDKNFDWEFYLNNYKDLKILPYNKKSALIHWYNYGEREGRCCVLDRTEIDNFNWEFYLNYYEDLKNILPYNREAVLSHWNRYGKREGRKSNP